MKRLFTVLLVVLLGLATWSCQYNDKELWDEIGGIKTELARINQEVGSLQSLVNALNQKKSIASVQESATGHTITFSDGTTTLIKNGTSAPLVRAPSKSNCKGHGRMTKIVISGAIKLSDCFAD